MPTVKALSLEEHLKRGQPAPVYALVGADDALRSRSLRLLEVFAAPADQPGSTVRRFEGAAEPRDVFGELRTVPFLGMQGRRAVVLEDGDAFLKSHGEPLAEYIRKPSRTATLIICLGKLDMRTSAAKAIESAGTLVDCSPPEKFVASLKETGAVVMGSHFFADHHSFRDGEIAALKARAGGARLVTTEKDFARLREADRADIAVLTVRVRFETETALDQLLERIA